MRKILRNMYLAAVPKKQRRKSFRDCNGRIILGTWREWRAKFAAEGAEKK